MRPISASYTPAAASATGFASGITGVGPWTPSATSSSDSMAHNVTIGSAANLSAITFTLTGTDADGNAQTEAVTGPNATTVTGAKFFMTLTGVSASATLGANTANIGWAATSISKTFPLEWRSNASAAMTVDISGTINFTVKETYANVYSAFPSTLPWASITALAAKTADTSGTATLGAQAVRLEVNSITAGATMALYLSQPSGFII